jgi:glycosidase
MKKINILITIFLIFFPVSKAQMITVDPAIPTTGKVIKIYYDSHQDAGDLKDYTGDLYVHTGVTMSNVNWTHVIGLWGNNTTQPKLTYLGNYKYVLNITPDVNTFYSLAPAEIPQKINLVIRNAGANLQTRPDIFIDVFQAGLNATFTLPAKSSLVVELNRSIPVSVAATLADSLSLYINNKYIKSGTTPDLLTDTITADQYGEFWVKTVAWDLPKFAADSFFCFVRKPLVTESLPAGIKDGINYTGNNSATLVLRAPYKNYVFAVGDFTGWQARDKGYMKVTPDGERYWIALTGLTPGKEYRFQYLVDTALYIADPYADKLLDPDNDQYITAATYPGLIKYPKDTASGMVSVLQTAQTPYSWKNNSFNPPQNNKLVIYELLVRDFVAEHSYKTLTDTLNYFKRLGVNAIELMPITEFEGNLSWGYNVSFYFAPDKYYGPKNTLKTFVDSCHSRGIAVIMDIVLNHCFGQSPFVQLYLDHYATDQIVMKIPNPWFNAVSPNNAYKWGADFNHESPATQELVDRILAYWMTDFKIDGFRFDFAKGFTNTPGDGGTYDASRIAILERMATRMWQVNPKAYVILELFAPNTEEKVLADFGMMPWGNMNYQYGEAAMGYASDLTFGTSLARFFNNPYLVTYMESHDEERLSYKAQAFGTTTATYNIKDRPTALKRMEQIAVFFLTIPGPKMIWQFGELGYDKSIDYNGRTGEKPILWNYTAETNRYRLFLIYKLLNNLRSSEEVFSTSDYTYSLTGMVKSIHLNSPSVKATILGNFDVTDGVVLPEFQQTGKWYEYFSGDSILVNSVNQPITLKAGEYRLYTTRRFSSPKTLLRIDDQRIKDPAHFVSVYPNPSAEFNIEINAASPSPVEISVLDLSGKLIRQFKTTIVSSGTDLVNWDGKNASGADAGKGIYFLRIKTSGRTETVKIIKN